MIDRKPFSADDLDILKESMRLYGELCIKENEQSVA
jgi:hypothetical protein